MKAKILETLVGWFKDCNSAWAWASVTPVGTADLDGEFDLSELADVLEAEVKDWCKKGKVAA